MAGPPGTIERSDQVRPPSVETKTGAFGPFSGSRVNAVATICCGSSGLTARFGSLSWAASPLSDRGIMFTIRSTVASHPALAQ